MVRIKNILLVLLLTSLAGLMMAQGNAVSFDGVNDHVQVSSPLGIGNVYTVEGWIYPTNLGGTGDLLTYGRTVFSASETSGSYPLWLTIYGQNIHLRTWTTATTDRVVNAGLAVNNWYHIAVTSTKGNVTRLYVNGVQIDSYTNANTTTWPGTFTLGAIRPVRPTSILPYQGLIDEVRVWNVIRTQSEILANMNVPVSPSSTGLVAYWKFDEISGTTAYDAAGTAQNGTLANGAFFVASDLTLPIQLSSFTATITSQYFVQLHWVTQSETDALGYMIYRSQDNNLENAIQVSPLINATNTTTQVSYAYTDSEVSPGTWFYWLQSLDLNGAFQFHGPVMATVTTEQGGDAPGIILSTGISNVYPNPFNPNLNIQFNLKDSQPVTIRIYNTRGQIVHSAELGNREAGIHNLNWDANGQSAGIYLIRMQAGDKFYNSKAVLSK